MSGRGLHLMAFNLAKVAETIAAELAKAAAAKLTLVSMGLVAEITLGVTVIGSITKLVIAAGRLERAIAMPLSKHSPKSTVGPLKNERHEIFEMIDRQIVDLEVPRSSRGGCTIEINDFG